MKTLKQLGISPAPWSAKNLRGYRVFNHEWFELCDSDSVFSLADARLIAAAPELYDMLQSLVEYIDRECIPCGETACELMAAAHNVLAKAAGESEVK